MAQHTHAHNEDARSKTPADTGSPKPKGGLPSVTIQGKLVEKLFSWEDYRTTIDEEMCDCCDDRDLLLERSDQDALVLLEELSNAAKEELGGLWTSHDQP